MKTVPVGVHVALVDDEDYELVRHYAWHPVQSGKNTYAQNGSVGLMHRYLVGDWHDHKDGNGLNNQRNNLRPITTSQNAVNARKRQGTISKFKGVTYNARPCGPKKWKAYITKDGIRRTKMFLTEEEAARWRDEQAKELFGEYAKLNFPEARQWE